MAKAPTKKSRLIAAAGMTLVTIGIISDTWLSPPLPKIGVPALGLAAVSLMYWAKQTRKSEGQEIPPQVTKAGSRIATIEIAFALASGLGVTAVLALEVSGGSKHVQQLAACATLGIFAATFVALHFTRRRFDDLMTAASQTGATA